MSEEDRRDTAFPQAERNGHQVEEAGTPSPEPEEELGEEVYDDDPWAEDVTYRRVGARRRARGWFRRHWAYYLALSVPEDDDGPEGLPRVLQGTGGRLIMAVCIFLALAAWAAGILAIINR